MELIRQQEIAHEINQAKKILSEIAAEKAVERWNTPVEELDLSMINSRKGLEIMRSAWGLHQERYLPPRYSWKIDFASVEVEAVHLLQGCCIEIAKEGR